jgi:hypothetical protein
MNRETCTAELIGQIKSQAEEIERLEWQIVNFEEEIRRQDARQETLIVALENLVGVAIGWRAK